MRRELSPQNLSALGRSKETTSCYGPQIIVVFLVAALVLQVLGRSRYIYQAKSVRYTRQVQPLPSPLNPYSNTAVISQMNHPRPINRYSIPTLQLLCYTPTNPITYRHIRYHWINPTRRRKNTSISHI